MHRGAKHAKGEYFGPFPNGYAVRETWRCCKKSSRFASAKTALSQPLASLPAVPDWPLSGALRGRAGEEEEYAQQVEYVRLFLAGKDDQVLTQLIARMEKASRRWSLKRRRAFAIRSRPCAG
jgi:excinuclease ABC subunit C